MLVDAIGLAVVLAVGCGGILNTTVAAPVMRMIDTAAKGRVNQQGQYQECADKAVHEIQVC